jgi:RNA polymerase sigma-70 factor, ECF subfamily
VRSDLEEAIALLRNADPASIEQALQLLERRVFAFGMKVCGRREDAEDTAQEVLLKLLPHVAKLQDPQALSAWLYTAARNRCWQGFRKHYRRKEVSLEDLLPSHTELSALLHSDPAASPEMQALRRQDHQLLHQAVLRLPPQYRIVLVLHDMEELDTALVAKILSLKEGTVRIRLHRARLMVRKELAKLTAKSSPGAPASKRSKAPSVECRQIFANLSEYLDGAMAPEGCDRMRRHIEACPTCVAFIQDLKQAIDRCRSLDVCPDSTAPPALRRLLTEEYLRLVKDPPQ